MIGIGDPGLPLLPSTPSLFHGRGRRGNRRAPLPNSPLLAIEKKCLEDLGKREEEGAERGSYLSCLGRPTCQPAISIPSSSFPLWSRIRKRSTPPPPPPTNYFHAHYKGRKINRV